MAGTFTTIVNKVDLVLNGFYGTAAAGMMGYIMPIAWVTFGLSMLIWSYLVIAGRISSPVEEALPKFIFIIVVLYLASGGYRTLIADPLYNMPGQIVAALMGSSVQPETILDSLFDKLLDMLTGIADAVVKLVSQFAFGGAIILSLVLGLMCITSVLLLCGAAAVFLYSKLALSLVLAIGPFFVVWLAWQPTRGNFYPWLNTVLYLVFLFVLTSLFILLFVNIVNSFMQTLMDAIAANASVPSASIDTSSISAVVRGLVSSASAAPSVNVFTAALQLAAVSLPFFFVLLWLPQTAQSVTAGAAGAFGNGMTHLVSTVRSLGRGSGSGSSPAPAPPAPAPAPTPAPPAP